MKKQKCALSILLVLALLAGLMSGMTLTASAAEAPDQDTVAFDLCDGSDVQIISPEDKPVLDNAWPGSADNGHSSMYNAFGYQLEGWYTEPNGWGTRISDENGMDPADPSQAAAFEAGQTYYAHWVWTQREEYVYPDDVYIFLELATPKTVYTTGMDFTGDAMNGHETGDGYAWADGTLTLSGFMLNARNSTVGVRLPADSKIFLENETNFPETTSEDVLESRNNIVAGGIGIAGELLAADILCEGDLEISSAERRSQSLIGAGAGIVAQGSITIDNPLVWANRVVAVDDISVHFGKLDNLTDIEDEGFLDDINRGIISQSGDFSVSNSFVFASRITAKNVTIEASFADCDTVECSNLSICDGSYAYFDVDLFAYDSITIKDSKIWAAQLVTLGPMELTDSTVNVQYEKDDFIGAVVMGDGSVFTNSLLNVTGIKGEQIGILSYGHLTIHGGTTKVVADSGETGVIGLILYSDSPDQALELDNAEITYPANAHWEVDELPYEGEMKYYQYLADDNGKYVTSLTISSNPCDGGRSCPCAGFYDLDSNAWYHEGVDYVLNHQLMEGVDRYKFQPEAETSRAMAATVLWRLAGCPETEAEISFIDVPEDAWYSQAVAWAASEGLVEGFGNGKFKPEASVTREQFAVMLYRYAERLGMGYSGSWMISLDYADADQVSDWAYEAMCWCTMNGVINGKEDNCLDPKGVTTRAEMAEMLMRLETALAE